MSMHPSPIVPGSGVFTMLKLVGTTTGSGGSAGPMGAGSTRDGSAIPGNVSVPLVN